MRRLQSSWSQLFIMPGLVFTIATLFVRSGHGAVPDLPVMRSPAPSTCLRTRAVGDRDHPRRIGSGRCRLGPGPAPAEARADALRP